MSRIIGAIFVFVCAAVLLTGCIGGYSSQSIYPRDVKSVYVEMFDNMTFRRDLEYDLTDAIAKRIETDTPYKIISDRSKADTVLSGKITSLYNSALTIERNVGRPLEEQAEVTAIFSWKDLRTGQYIVSDKSITATASYSEFQQQGFKYGSKVAANKLAERIVEGMQTDW
ncbi:MAG: LPS assembly lipoprotein LptE [Phycisphaerae bacterium]|jgi:hypothetical protein